MSKVKKSGNKYSDLPCSTIVFRALIWEDCVDSKSGRVMPAAFMRRNHEQGLSVGVNTTVDDYLRKHFKKPTYGVGTLHVGRLRDLQLEVVQDKPDHATLTGVPKASDNPVEAERLASQLARQARWQPQSSELTAEQE
jgi:hypothetical protein